jgi:LPXTG-motif cell wall-anchored protein
MIHLAQFPAPVRILAFLLLLLLLWLPFVGLAYWLLEDPNTISLMVMPILFSEFIVLLQVWGQRVYHHLHPLQHYGLTRTRQNGLELLQGLSMGLISLLSLFLSQSWLGWLSWQPLHPRILQFVLEGLIIALGFGLGEELIFRGWLLDELQRDYQFTIALWLDSLIFACLHFIRPLDEILQTSPQFFGLFVLGLILVWAKRGSGDRLGLPMGLHAGFVWGFYMINVGQLVNYTNRVPAWVTGINQNPLAGIMGLLFLSALAIWMRRRSRQKSTLKTVPTVHNNDQSPDSPTTNR